MKILLSAALAVLLACPVFAIGDKRFNPMDFEIETTTQTKGYLTHRIVGGPCTKSPEEFHAHTRAIEAFVMPRFQNAEGEIIILVVGYDDAYAEGWKLENEEACLVFLTVKHDEAA